MPGPRDTPPCDAEPGDRASAETDRAMPVPTGIGPLAQVVPSSMPPGMFPAVARSTSAIADRHRANEPLAPGVSSKSPSATAIASTPPARLSGPPPQLEAPLIAALGSLSRVPVLAFGATKLNLDPRAAFVLHLIDGMSSVEDLHASGQPRIGILQLLAELLASGVITMR